MFASFEGHLRIVELLLKGNANPNICNKLGSTALKFAMQNSHLQVVELLLMEDADSSFRNIAGRAGLYYSEIVYGDSVLFYGVFPIANVYTVLPIHVLNTYIYL